MNIYLDNKVYYRGCKLNKNFIQKNTLSKVEWTKLHLPHQVRKPDLLKILSIDVMRSVVSSQRQCILAPLSHKPWEKLYQESPTSRTSLVAQWLRIHVPSAGGLSSIPGQGTRSHILQLKLLHAANKDPMCCNWDLMQTNKSINIITKI